VSGSELSRWRSSWGEAAEAQWVAAGQGRYKESAAQFLVSTWQGDALMVRRLALQCHEATQSVLRYCGWSVLLSYVSVAHSMARRHSGLGTGVLAVHGLAGV
jgi:hypothetical protein